jgi:phosphatidylglycerol---prolipoprotein diacylglyceryl transferase
MQQVLFHLPFFKESFPPDGFPVHGFGLMLFITFFVAVYYIGKRVVVCRTGMPKEKVEPLIICLFVGGLAGARITYMIQYGIPWQQFIRIWEGGIVLYGGIIAGTGAFLIFYWRVLRPHNVYLWRLADALAPGLALGIALGRVGCLLNGCCYGHVACEECAQIGFPVMTAPVRDVVVNKFGYQTPLGFTTQTDPVDVRTKIAAVEVGSNAERAGLKAGDRIVGVDGKTNEAQLDLEVPAENRDRYASLIETGGGTIAGEKPSDTSPGKIRFKVTVGEVAKVNPLKETLQKELVLAGRVFDGDTFGDIVRTWPRGKQSIALSVERDGKTVVVDPFVPRSIGVHPTQIYETISMLLLMGMLTFFYPFRRYDGQAFTLFVACYAVHRFVNEVLRNDTDVEGFSMTLSQNISVLMLLFAFGLELGHRMAGRHRAFRNAGTVQPTPGLTAGPTG